MREDDVTIVDGLAVRAFDALYAPLGHPPAERDADRVKAGLERLRHLVATDPDGCWVAEAGGAVAGAALALRRGDFWGLSLLAVDPVQQAAGAGRMLLAAALTTSGGARGMIPSSLDTRAIRLYNRAGFDLHPAMHAVGEVLPGAVPQAAGVSEGGEADLGHTVEVDLAVRGAAHGDDLGLLLAHGGRLFVADGGYAVLRGGDVALLAATSEDVAQVLLWCCLGAVEPGVEVSVSFLTAAHGWAMRVLLEAGLRLEPGGPLFLRGMSPAPLYLPNGAWL